MINNNNIDKQFLKYNEALQILKEKFQILYKENLKLGEANPIGHIKYRIKSKKSIQNKLKNKFNLDFTTSNIEENLHDIAGIRIVCPFLSDINKIINYINKDSDINVIKVKNYIKSPKPNGYSGYHMIVSVPILIDGIKEYIKAEIQIRTMAMDVIASLDHKLKYKNDITFSKEMEQRLQEIVNFVNLIDIEMDNIIQVKRQHSKEKVLINSLPNISNEKNLNIFLKKYKIALKNVADTINTIKEEYLINEMVNPIEHINGRIKPIDSIIAKLAEKNKELTFKNVEEYINDVGAIKIVCSFLSDVQEIINKINEQKDFVIIDRQDYITNPKECGYSSYHFVVAVPIKVAGEMTTVKIEIQVRTIIMDFWANIEHILCYKKDVDASPKEEMKRIASILQIIDPEMDKLDQIIKEETNIFNKSKLKRKVKTKKKKTNQ